MGDIFSVFFAAHVPLNSHLCCCCCFGHSCEHTMRVVCNIFSSGSRQYNGWNINSASLMSGPSKWMNHCVAFVARHFICSLLGFFSGPTFADGALLLSHVVGIYSEHKQYITTSAVYKNIEEKMDQWSPHDKLSPSSLHGSSLPVERTRKKHIRIYFYPFVSILFGSSPAHRSTGPAGKLPVLQMVTQPLITS